MADKILVPLDNSIDYPIENLFGLTSGIKLTYTDGNIEKTIPVFVNTRGYIMIPAGIFSTKQEYAVTLHTLTIAFEYIFDVTRLKSYGTSNVPSSCGGSCGCGKPKCECEKPDMTPFLNRLQEVDCSLIEVLQEFRKYANLPLDLKNLTKQVSTVVLESGNNDANIKAIVDELNNLEEALKVLDTDFAEFERANRLHLREFDKLAKEVKNIQDEIAELEKLRKEILSLLELDKDVDALMIKVGDIEKRLNKYDFEQIELNKKAIAAIEKLLNGVDLDQIETNKNNIQTLKEFVEKYKLGQIEINAEDIAKIYKKLNDINDELANLKRNKLDVEVHDKYVEKAKAEFADKDQIVKLQDELDDLCADLGKLTTFVNDTNKSNTDIFNDLTGAVKNANGNASRAVSTADNALDIANRFERRLNTVDKEIADIIDVNEIQTTNIDKLFESNKEIVQMINETNNRVDNMAKDINNINRKLDKILGSTNSCPDVPTTGTVSPCSK